MALQWLRDFVLPPPPAVTVALPSSLLHCSLLSQVVTAVHTDRGYQPIQLSASFCASIPESEQVVHTAFRSACMLQVLPLSETVAHGQLCACHKAPLADAGLEGIAGSYSGTQTPSDA